MAKIINEPKRLCDIIYNGPISELGFIMGPAYNCKLTNKQIESMVAHGKKVYEINPQNRTEKVLLDVRTCLTNVFSDNTKKPDVKAPSKLDNVIVENTDNKETEVKTENAINTQNNSNDNKSSKSNRLDIKNKHFVKKTEETLVSQDM